MVQQISALIVQPAVDASKYTAGAQEKVAADKAMAASSREAGAAAVDTSAKISTGGDVLSRLSRQYVEGYAAQQRFSQGLGQLSRGLETGRISIEGAERILIGMNQRLGLTANAAELAAKGQMTLASAVERANVQIARQANDLSAADAANRRMQAANSNVISAGARRAAGFNAGQQLQDIAMMSLVGQSPGILALQQGPQLATAIQQGGGLAAVGAGLASVFSMTTLLTVGFTAATAATIQWAMKGKDGAKSLDDALKAHSDTLKLLKDQYGALGEAAKTVGNAGGLAFTEASARNAQTLLQAQLRQQQQPFLAALTGSDAWYKRAIGRTTGSGALEQLKNLTGDQKLFAGPVEELLRSVRDGKSGMDAFDASVEKAFSRFLPGSENPAALRATADAVKALGVTAFDVSGKFAAFADPINRLKLEGAQGIATFNAEVEEIGRNKGIQSLADDAIVAGKEFVSLIDKANELDRVLHRIELDKFRPGLTERRELGSYLGRRQAEFNSINAQFDADQQMARARTNAERLAAVEAQVRARAREDADKGGGLQPRIDRALAQERTRQEVEARDATIQRNQALERSLQQQRIELDLIGKTGGEQAKLRFEFERMQELREQAARTGSPIDQKEVAAIRAAAEEMKKYADAIALAKLGNDLQFDRDQLARSPLDQRIAQGLRGAGQPVDLDSQVAKEIRINEILKQRVGLWNDIRDTGMDAIDQLVSSASRGFDDIGEAMEGIASDITKQILQLSVANPLKNAIYGAGLPTLDDAGGIGGFLGTLLGKTPNPAAGFQSVGAMTVNAGSVVVTGSIGVNGGAAVLDRLFPAANTNGANLPISGMSSYAAAIRSIESAGNGGYSALGPLLKNGDQALGAYGIMRSNLPSWSMAALGRNVSQSEFMGSSSIQDAIFKNQFGSYLSKYGNPQDAASTWFTGRPLASGKNAVDILGTSGAAYVEKFNRALGGTTSGVMDFGKGLRDGLGQFGDGLGDLWGKLGTFLQSPLGGGSSWFQGLSSMFGGISGAMSHMLSISPAATGDILSGVWGAFDRGGYTGDGGKYQVAGLAHRGEFYFSKEATANLGVDFLSSLHEAGRRGRGFAGGGFAGGAAPSGSRTSGASSQNSGIKVVVNNYGEPTDASVRQSTDADGSTVIEVMMEKKIRDEVTRPSASTNRQLRGTYGLSNQVVRR